ncbi:MAG: polysaccharide biosynthesis/export family protein [Pirellulaceae bacterium]|nr:polysaccharide biosynthesis/export family protein [Pirellulaceae bacterium]
MSINTFKTTFCLSTSHWLMLLAMMTLIASSGCAAILAPIDAIPVERLPPQFYRQPESAKVAIDVARLRQPKPPVYTLDDGDVLGIFIEGVLGNIDEAPPVQFQDPNSDLPPAIGYPVPVREDGTISLPLVRSISVRGLSIQQVEQLIARVYRQGERPILQENNRIIVSLLRKRTYRVFVVRQDNTNFGMNPQIQAAQLSGGRGVFERSDQSRRGFVLQMPAGENDLMNALAQTGGMPGLNAKNEVRILRGDRLSAENRMREVDEFYRTNNAEDFPYGAIPQVTEESAVLKIPMRYLPNNPPRFTTEDIVLRDGDIVYVDTRETDVYYTGGLLVGGEWPLPRDYDLDVLGAIALSGSSIGVGQRQSSSLLSGLQGVPASELIVLRKLPGNQQIAIRIDVNRAINNPRSRLLVQPGDTLILRQKPQEEATNFALVTFFTFGLRSIFR